MLVFWNLFAYVLNKWTLCFNVAIIELKRPIKWIKNKVQPICLPDETNPIPDDYKCNLIGWGQTIFDVNESLSDVLRFAEITTIPLNICNQEKAFNNTISSDNSICGKGRDFSVSPCTKDSGGGLSCQKSGKWIFLFNWSTMVYSLIGIKNWCFGQSYLRNTVV